MPSICLSSQRKADAVLKGLINAALYLYVCYIIHSSYVGVELFPTLATNVAG